MAADQIHQISILESFRAHRLVPSTEISHEQDVEDSAACKAVVFDADDFLTKLVGASMLYMPRERQEHMAAVQEVLGKALVNVVERWWADEDAEFHKRMPLHEAEERILRWIAGEGRKTVPSFEKHMGTIRPDFVIEKDHKFRVCEINSRVPYNGFCSTAQIIQNLGLLGLEESMLEGTIDMDSALMAMFDTSKPLHVLHEHFHDTHVTMAFTQLYSQLTGQTHRTVKPGDLRLLGEHEGRDGHRLYAVIPNDDDHASSVGVVRIGQETLEPVYQTSLCLEQSEFHSVPFEILCELAPICVNDLRNIFMVNDQRILGIILEELDNLVSVQKVLTVEEAALLGDNLVPSYLTHSPTWQTVLEKSRSDPTTKDGWVLKGARAASGNGHVFGHTVSNEEWLQHLELGTKSNCGNPTEETFLLQKLIDQEEFDIVHHKLPGVNKLFLVGSWAVVNNKFLGFSVARLAKVVQLKMNGDAQLLLAGFMLRQATTVDGK